MTTTDPFKLDYFCDYYGTMNHFPLVESKTNTYFSNSSSEWAKVQLTPRGQVPRKPKSRHRLILYLVLWAWGAVTEPSPRGGLRAPWTRMNSTSPATTSRAASTACHTSTQLHRHDSAHTTQRWNQPLPSQFIWYTTALRLGVQENI